MKKALIALAVVVLVLLAGLLVAPSFVDWNAYKAQITAEAERMTGRALTIEGDVGLSLLPSPAVSAEKVTLANIEGGSQPAMAELEALRIRAALLPLLTGHLRVESVVLVEPRILLERLPDGRVNWASGPTRPAQAAEQASQEQNADASQVVPETPPTQTTARMASDDADFTVQVESFIIEDGTLLYRDGVSGQRERLEAINATVVAETLQGPFSVDGEALVRGLETRIDATMGRLPSAGAAGLALTVSLPASATELQYNGTLSRHPDSYGLRGRLRGEGEDLGMVIAAALKADDLPPALANPFTLDAELTGDPKQVDVNSLRFTLADTALEGEGQLLLGETVEASARLSASRIDLDQLLASAREGGGEADEARVEAPPEALEETAQEEGGAPSGEDAAPSGEGAAAGFMLPEDVSASLQLAVDALIYRGQVVRQVRFNAAMSEGRVELNQATALLPGGSDVSLTGGLVAAGGEPSFDGRLEGASDNLRGVLDWLGLEVGAVPADRLRKASLSARVQGGPRQVSLSEIDLRVDVSRLAGGVVAVLRERPGFGVGLALDNLNLDAYLPRPGAGAGEPEPAQGAPAASQEGGEGAAPGQEPEAGDPLDAFDANFNLRLAQLTYRGQTARDVVLQGSLQEGRLTFQQASVEDLAGSRLSYSGTLSGLSPEAEVEGALDLRIADPNRLARLADLENEALARVGPLNLTGNLKGSLRGLGFNTRVAAFGGTFALAGKARPLAAPFSFDATLEAQHPDLAGFARAATGEALLGEPEAGLGGLDLTARVAGTPLEVTVSELAGQAGPATLDGGLTLDLAGPEPRLAALDLGFQARHSSVATLSRALGGPALAGELGGLDMSGRVSGGLARIDLQQLSGVVGPLGLSGSVALLPADGAARPETALGDFNLSLRLKSDSLAKVASAAGAGSAVNPAFGGVDLSAHAFGNATRVNLRDLEGSLGPVSLSGTASLDLSGARPFASANLRTGELPLALLLAPGAAAGGGGSGSGGGGGGSGGGGSGGGAGGATIPGGAAISDRWSREPIDLSGLSDANVDLTLQATAITHEDLRLESARVGAAVTDGVLNLNRLSGGFFGGNLEMSGLVDGRGDPGVTLSIRATDVQSEPLLRALADVDRVSGPVTLNAELRGRGASEAALISNLSGHGDLRGSLTVQARAEEQGAALLLDLLGDKVKEVRGLASTSNALLQAFAGAPSALTGSFAVDRGVVRSDDLRLEGSEAFALTRGTADLPAWWLESRTDVYRGGAGGDPFLFAVLSGPIDEPDTRIGGEPFQRRPQPSTEGSGSGTESGSGGSGASEPARPVTPEDLLKGLLKKL